MERIKQALERARAERDAVVGDDGGVLGPLLGELGRRRRQTRPPAAELKISYTRTATVPVDPGRLREKRIILTEEHDIVADAYKVLRTHVLQRMRANGWRTLGVTSPTEGNGKTLTSINLAISLAREVNQTILLVDLDLRRPTLGSYLFDRPTRGLSDYLTEGVALEELLIHPGIDRLVVLPGNHSFTQSSEMLSSPRMVQLVQEFRTRYADRLTLFDMPPLLVGDDVMAFLPNLDAVMLVIEEGKTTKEELSQGYELLADKNILGTVLNKAEEASTGIGYY